MPKLTYNGFIVGYSRVRNNADLKVFPMRDAKKDLERYRKMGIPESYKAWLSGYVASEGVYGSSTWNTGTARSYCLERNREIEGERIARALAERERLAEAKRNRSSVVAAQGQRRRIATATRTGAARSDAASARGGVGGGAVSSTVVTPTRTRKRDINQSSGNPSQRSRSRLGDYSPPVRAGEVRIRPPEPVSANKRKSKRHRR